MYAYRCTKCGHRFEKIQNFSAEPESECPMCQGVLERPLTAPGLHFKGAGWYVNDYAPKSSVAASESAPTAAPAAAPCGGGGCSACPAAAAAASAPAATSGSTN